MNFIRHIRVIISAAIPMLFIYCIRDPLDGCGTETNLVLFFSYLDTDGNDILHMMSRAGVYIYDTDDKMAAEKHIGPKEFTASDRVGFTLPPGEYYAVAWGDRPVEETDKNGYYVPMHDGEKYHYAPRQSFLEEEYHALRLIIPEKGIVTETLEYMPVWLSIDVWIYGLDDNTEGTVITPLLQLAAIPDGFDLFLKETRERDLRETGVRYVITPEGDRALWGGFVLPYFYPSLPNDLKVYQEPDGDHLYTVNLYDFMIDNELSVMPGDHIEIYIRFSGDIVIEVGMPGWINKPITPLF